MFPQPPLSDRVVPAWTLLIRPNRLVRAAIVLKPSTLLRLHRALTTLKYRRLFSSTVPTAFALVTGLRHTRSGWTSPFIVGPVRGATRLDPLTGDPSQLMSLAGVSSCRVAWRPSSGLEPQACPTRHTMRMTSRKGVAAGLGGEAQRQSEAPRQSDV
jgi:hypothetical protein